MPKFDLALIKKLAASGKIKPETLKAAMGEAEKILAHIDTPEKATKLVGAEREAYLAALDAKFGTKDLRAKGLGFGDRTWYHGTTGDIDQFQKEALGASTNAQSAKSGFFFAQDPSTASDYANLAGEYGVTRDAIRERKSLADLNDFGQAMQSKYGKTEMNFGNGPVDTWESRLKGEDKAQYERLKAKADSDEAASAKASEFESNLKNKKSEVHADVDAARMKLRRFVNEKDSLEKVIKIREKGDIPDGISEAEHAAMLNDLKKKLAVTDQNIQVLNSDTIPALKKNWAALSNDLESVGQNVVPVRLKGDASNIHVKDYQGQGYRDTTYANEMERAKADGKTGVLFKKTFDPADPNNRVQQDIAAVFEPDQIRSTNAAFDPRFAKSPLIMAGAAAAPAGFENPLDMMKPGLDAYEAGKEKLAGLAANQMDLTKDKSETARIQAALGLVADPVNLVPGAPGVGLGVLQGMGAMTPKKPRFDAATLQGLYKGGKISEQTFKHATGYAEGGAVGLDLSLVPDMKAPVPTAQEIEAQLTAQGRMPRDYKTIPNIGNGFDTGGAAPSQQQVDSAMDIAPEVYFPGALAPKNEPVAAESEPMVEGYEPSAQLISDQQGMEVPEQDQTMNLMEAGLMANMDANSMETNATIQGLQKTQEILAKQAEIDSKMNMERQLQLDEQQMKVDLAAQDYLQGKVDPNRIWADKSTGQKLGMAAALFLSGINGSQAGAQILNNAIDRDLEAQKADLGRLKGGFDMQRTMLSDMMNRFGDERQAMAAAKLTQIQMAELQVKTQLARAQGTRGYAEGLQGMAKLQQMKTEAAKRYQMAAMLNPENQRQMDFTRGYMSLPPEYQERAVKLPGNKLGIAISPQAQKDLIEAIPAYENLDKIYEKLEKGGSAFAGLAKRGELESLEQQALMMSRAIDKSGALDNGVVEVFKKMTGGATSLNQAGFKAKIQSTRENLKSRKESELGYKLMNYQPLNLKRVK